MRTVVHIGFPKSASSSLQNLWYETGEAYFAGKLPRRNKRRYVTNGLRDMLSETITLPYRSSFDLPKCRAIADKITAMARDAGKDTILVSLESLCAVHLNRYGTHRAPFEVVVERLANVFGPNTTILMITREQRALLKSIHAQIVTKGYSTSFRTFVDKSIGKPKGLTIFDGPLPGLRFDEVIADARAAGLATVWMPFEYLISGGGQALKRLATDIGIGFDTELPLPHVNKTRDERVLLRRMKKRQSRLSKFDGRERLVVRAYDRRQKKKGLVRQLDYSYTDEQNAFLAEYFAGSNAALGNGLYDLASYGYALPG